MVLQRDVEVEAVRAVCEPQSEVRVVDGDDEVPRAVADGLHGGAGVGGHRTLGVQLVAALVEQPDAAVAALRHHLQLARPVGPVQAPSGRLEVA